MAHLALSILVRGVGCGGNFQNTYSAGLPDHAECVLYHGPQAIELKHAINFN